MIITFSAISCVHNHKIDIFLVRDTSHMRHERNVVTKIRRVLGLLKMPSVPAVTVEELAFRVPGTRRGTKLTCRWCEGSLAVPISDPETAGLAVDCAQKAGGPWQSVREQGAIRMIPFSWRVFLGLSYPGGKALYGTTRLRAKLR